MELQQFKDKAEILIVRFNELIKELPDNGNTSEESQKITIKNAVNNLEHTINGTEESDLISLYGLDDEEIETLIITAFEGGVNYWCGRVEILKRNHWDSYFEGEEYFASQVIKNGGDLLLHDAESDDNWLLTKKKIVENIPKTMRHYGYTKFQDFMDDHDAEMTDVLIQFALFNKIVFG